GRQGDPGSSRFYSSLEDDLIRIFASERVAGLMARLGFDDTVPIESGMVTGAITQAQIKVEGRNFDIRKRALEFDEVLNNQRDTNLGEELARVVERWILLRTIDIHWVEHLTAMEELREGIYLRGYGQQDPLVAYKREAHTFFEEMSARIASGVAQQILRVTVKTAEQAEQAEQAQAQTQTGGGTTTTAPMSGD